MEQTCTKCGKTKSAKEFSWKDKRRKKRHPRCKECMRIVIREHYAANREIYNKRTSEYNKRNLEINRKWVLEYWREHPCVDCGESHPACLEFDHVKGTKKMAISRMLNYKHETLLKEVEKCVVRCSNCHKKKTANDQNWFSK